MIKLKLFIFLCLFSGNVFAQCLDVEIVFESPNACAGGPEDIYWSLYSGNIPLLENIYHYFPITPPAYVEPFCLPEGEYTIEACGSPNMNAVNFSGEILLNGQSMLILDGPHYVDGCFSCTVAIAEPCLGDLNFDGAINVSDMLILLSQIGCSSDCTADLDASGGVSVPDLLLFLSLLGSSCD
jgi:hypothetical protein